MELRALAREFSVAIDLSFEDYYHRSINSVAASIMVAESLSPFLQGTSGQNTRGLLRIIILCTIAGAAVASRLFSVIREYLDPPCWIKLVLWHGVNGS